MSLFPHFQKSIEFTLPSLTVQCSIISFLSADSYEEIEGKLSRFRVESQKKNQFFADVACCAFDSYATEYIVPVLTLPVNEPVNSLRSQLFQALKQQRIRPCSVLSSNFLHYMLIVSPLDDIVVKLSVPIQRPIVSRTSNQKTKVALPPKTFPTKCTHLFPALLLERTLETVLKHASSAEKSSQLHASALRDIVLCYRSSPFLQDDSQQDEYHNWAHKHFQKLYLRNCEQLRQTLRDLSRQLVIVTEAQLQHTKPMPEEEMKEILRWGSQVAGLRRAPTALQNRAVPCPALHQSRQILLVKPKGGIEEIRRKLKYQLEDSSTLLAEFLLTIKQAVDTVEKMQRSGANNTIDLKNAPIITAPKAAVGKTKVMIRKAPIHTKKKAPQRRCREESTSDDSTSSDESAETESTTSMESDDVNLSAWFKKKTSKKFATSRPGPATSQRGKPPTKQRTIERKKDVVVTESSDEESEEDAVPVICSRCGLDSTAGDSKMICCSNKTKCSSKISEQLNYLHSKCVNEWNQGKCPLCLPVPSQIGLPLLAYVRATHCF